MSGEGETQVNNESAAAPAAPAQRTVSAQAVLLSAIDLAQSRGAFKVTEMSLITQAYNMIAAEEQKKNPPAPAPAAEESTETSQ